MADVDNRLDREDGIRTMDEYTKICMKEFTSRTNLEHVILMANASQDVRCDAAAELASIHKALEICVMFLTNINTITDEAESELVSKLKLAGEVELADAITLGGFAAALKGDA